MNTVFLKTFTHLVNTPNVRKVAAQEYTTPSTISMRIKSLESELNVKLFDREKGMLKLTDHGKRLYTYAESVLKAVDELILSAGVSESIQGVVRIGIIETIVLTLLPDFMVLMRERYPGIEIDLHVDSSTNLMRKLSDGHLDIIICLKINSSNKKIATQDLISFRNIWVTKENFFSMPPSLNEIFLHPIMTQSSNTSPYHEALSLIRVMASSCGVSISDIRITSTPSLAALVALIKEGLGVGIIPGILITEPLRNKTLIRHPITEPKPMEISLWYRDEYKPVIGYTTHIIKEVCQQYAKRQDIEEFVTLR